MDAQNIIQQLNLKPLPEEGGFYRETFRDPGRIDESALPEHSGVRSFSTCIYYLITPEEFSGLHLVRSAEIFHFYAGDPVEMIQIDSNGCLETYNLGPLLEKNYLPQAVVPKNTWQGTRLTPGGRWALLGCTVAPGFEFADFVGGNRTDLIEKFPQHQDLITKYTRV